LKVEKAAFSHAIYYNRVDHQIKKEKTAMKKAYQIVNARNKRATKVLEQALEDQGHALLPLVDLIETGQLFVQDFLMSVSQAALQAVLEISAQSVAGPFHQGKLGGDVRRHGSQAGTVCLATQHVRVSKPRLRDRNGGEVEVPAYTAMRNKSGLTQQVGKIMMRGVSTRNYREVVPDMAEACGISKSSVSREFAAASAEQLKELCARRFDDQEILVVYIDGVCFGGHCAIGVLGVDDRGHKHVLGLAEGATENGTVVKGLLEDLVERGLDPTRRRLFVIDGSKALRSAIDCVFGRENPVQRCRHHKISNVLDYVSKELKPQLKAVMQAAYKMEADKGISQLRKQARWLEQEYPSAAASLLEGLEETFTINRLNLPPELRRCLGTTNIIESPHSGVRGRTRRVTHWQDGGMILRWAAAAFLSTEKNFRRIMGHAQLWTLKAALDQDFALQKETVAA
jgi:transposase-like protein